MRFASQIIRSPLDLLYYSTLGQWQSRKHLLVACMPKSGSTYLFSMLAAAMGIRPVSLMRWRADVENNINLEEALRKNRFDYVAQIHVKYNENTRFAIDKFGMTPIVMVRNIFDCVVSFRDHLRRESHAWPFARFTEEHVMLSDAELESMIAHLVIPWYIDFYVSWKSCPNALWIVYREMIGDVEGTLLRIGEHVGIPLDRSDIRRAVSEVNPDDTRKNVGIVGRGEALAAETMELIARYRRFYPDVDFSLIGMDEHGQSVRMSKAADPVKMTRAGRLHA